MINYQPENLTNEKAKAHSKDDGLVASNMEAFQCAPFYDVALSVQRGEAVGLLGPNGAGKPLVFVMIGLMTPNYGSVHLDGLDISSLAMHKRARLGIGYLPQEASIFRGLTVE